MNKEARGVPDAIHHTDTSETLEYITGWNDCRAAMLAEQPAQQEPVARQYQNRDGVWKDFISEKHYKDTLEDGSWPIRNLYPTPQAQPAREFVGLTDEERYECLYASDCRDALCAAIAAKLMEKNNG